MWSIFAQPRLSVASGGKSVRKKSPSITDILAYSDTAYSDSLATVTLLASPKSFINKSVTVGKY